VKGEVKMYKKYFGLILFVFLLNLPLLAQQSLLTELNDFIPEELKYAGFKIDAQQEIKIEAAGMEPDLFYSDATMSFAWILKSDTREVVWHLQKAEETDNSGDLSYFEDAIDLKPGTYEVYYSTFLYDSDPPRWGRYYHWKYDRRGFFTKLFSAIFDDDDYHRERLDWDLFDEFYINVNGAGQKLSSEDIESLVRDKNESDLINLNLTKNDFYQQYHLKVDKDVKLNIYALGEADRDGEYDFGRIINFDTREKVWQLDYRNSDHAGGAYKNRMVQETIELEAGEYSILYVTDDSHSFRRWNMHPPYDPLKWGFNISFENATDQQYVKLTEMQEITDKNEIIDITEMRDNDYVSQGFTLKKPLDLHIYAIGEGRSGDMFDFARIVNANSRKEVWRMDYYDTESAGGAEKNRLIDEIVHFEPGNYIVYYLTDDSHSYKDWNSTPPYDQKHWGITIYAKDENYQEGDVAEYIMEEDENILIRMTRIGDYEKKRQSFELIDDGKVHIYAIGEGTYGDMYDYAWIENSETGRVVWEMTYRKTERAGGARKNRLFDDTVYLEKGEYDVYYRTDDSHSFEEWNDSPPYDPESWGITIYSANTQN
jgi:hypothetical protein